MFYLIFKAALIMAWPFSGIFSGLTDPADLRTALSAECWAVNEREASVGHGGYTDILSITRSGTTATLKINGGAAVGTTFRVYIDGADQPEYNGIHTIESVMSPTLPAIVSITRSGTTATVTFASNHGLSTSETITISGATQADYNGTFAIASTPTGTTLTYTVSGSPATPATGSPVAVTQGQWEYTVSGSPASPATTGGTLRYGNALTEFIYNVDEDTKKFPIADDFEDLPVHRVRAAAQTVTAITQSLGVMTVRLPGHGRRVGDYVVIDGANEDGYNGEFVVDTVPGSISVTSITRSGTTATVTSFAAHGLTSGDVVYIAGANQSEYNGAFAVTVTGATTFTYTVSGTPATPATGTITMKDYSRFTYASDSLDPSASGTITAQGRRTHIYYASWSGGNGTVLARNHGFDVGDWVHIQHDSDSTWRLWVKVTFASSHSFTFAHAGSLSAATYSSTAGFWCSRPIGIRLVAQQLRSAIETMITPTTFHWFVQNDGVFETANTVSSILTPGSFGSSWLSLVNCDLNAVGDVLEQIREALEEIVYARNDITRTGSIDYESRTGNGATQTASWDALLADSDAPTSGSGATIGNISQERNGSYTSSAVTSADIEYEWIGLPGAFEYAALQAWQSNSEDVDQDAMELTDDDGGIWTFDLANGSPPGGVVTVEIDSAWFSSGSPRTFGFTTTLPALHPFDSMAAGEVSSRSANAGSAVSATISGFLVHDISSVMTYG